MPNQERGHHTQERHYDKIIQQCSMEYTMEQHPKQPKLLRMHVPASYSYYEGASYSHWPQEKLNRLSIYHILSLE